MKTAEYWLEHCATRMTRAGVFFGHGTDNAHDEAAWMVLHVLDASLDGRFSQWQRVLNQNQQDELEHLLMRRIEERCPLAYLTGEARFCGLNFIVSPDVLVPRSPLAELVAGKFSPWLDFHGKGHVLDMCTGGGCIAIATSVYMPELEVDAVDISPAALAIADLNSQRHDVADRVHLIHSNLFTQLDQRRYDLIVSNPPYVSAEVFEKLPAEYQAEPSNGLLCGEDGLDIVLQILDASPEHLKQHGILLVEVGESAQALIELLPRVPFLWLDFQHGGDGVFLLDYHQLTACHSEVRAVMEHRSDV